MQAEEVRKGIG